MKTLVIGASPNPLRYSHKAVKRLRAYNVEVAAIGKRPTVIEDVEVVKGKPALTDIHTVTLYVGPTNQEEYLNYIVSLKPERIIFNPGTYNQTLDKMATQAGISCVEDCTLVMLASDSY